VRVWSVWDALCGKIGTIPGEMCSEYQSWQRTSPLAHGIELFLDLPLKGTCLDRLRVCSGRNCSRRRHLPQLGTSKYPINTAETVHLLQSENTCPSLTIQIETPGEYIVLTSRANVRSVCKATRSAMSGPTPTTLRELGDLQGKAGKAI
jgi:hypothetical protein